MYLFPHLARLGRSPKVRSVRSAFDGSLYYPGPKDRRLVLRTAAATPTKDLTTFIDVARLCPDHRFVLVIGLAKDLEAFADEILEYNQSRGSPVDVRINLPTESVARLMREAGLYLHTFASHLPFGMPISIGEAMASGAYVLARPCEGSREYLGNVGGFYDSVQEAAAFIRDTTTWSDARWSEAAREAAEWAYDRHADQRVLRALLEDWQVLARRVRPISTPAPSRPVSDPGSPVINLPPVRIVK